MPDTAAAGRYALISDVQSGSPAEKAGIERMDVIREFNGIAINNATDLPPLVGALMPGSRAKLTVVRNGKPRELSVVLSELDEQPQMIPASAEPAATHANPLGIVGEDIQSGDRQRLGLEREEGVTITRIEGLAAKRAGLQPGDIILAVGRASVGTVAQLDRALSALKPGDTAMLLVQRGGSSRYIAVSPRPAAETQ